MGSDVWEYKNFNMVYELDVAGEFIYNGIQELNRMSVFYNNGPAFSSLYNISVGIERLQKIILVLWKLDKDSDFEKFEKSLITHSHCALESEIRKYTDQEKLNNREQDFLSLINGFYKSARYNRFNIDGKDNYEVEIFYKYLKKYEEVNLSCFDSNVILMTDKIKELLGRVVGGISKKYYKLVEVGSRKNGTYTYELRSRSKAQKVFLVNFNKQSLMEGQFKERISFKELLLYIRNSKEESAFLKYMSDIPPLEFDKGLIIDYIHDLSHNIVSQSLVDEVEHLYDENEYSYERAKNVDLIGLPHVPFDYKDILKCNSILEKILNHKTIDKNSIDSLNYHAKFIDEYEVVDIINNVKQIYEEYKDGIYTLDNALDKIKKLHEEYQEYIY